MKNKILGLLMGSVVAAGFLLLTGTDTAEALSNTRYDTSTCYSKGVYGVQCITPMNFGPCHASVDCTGVPQQ